MDTSFALVDMHPCEQVQVLCLFFEMATKQNGDLYPSGTLYNLMSAFQRTLRKAQEKRIMLSGKDAAPFMLKNSPLFRSIGLACVLAMRQSRKAGVGVIRRQVHLVILSIMLG